MFSNNSKYLLVSGFVLIIGLMVALTAIGLTRMAAIHHRMEAVADRHNVKADLIFSMRNIVRERSLSLYLMYLMEDPFAREDEFIRFTNMAGEFIVLRDRFVAAGLNDEEQQILSKTLGLIRRSQPLQVNLVERIVRERRNGVREAMLHEDLPLEMKILALLDRLVNIERRAAQEDVRQAAGQYRSALTSMIVLLATAILLAVLVAWYVVRRTRQIENALLQEKEQAQVTLHSVGDAVITADVDGNVVYLNPIAEQLTGWRNDEAHAVSLREVYSIVDEATRRPLEHPAMVGVLDGRITGINRDVLLVGRTGEHYAVEDSAAPIRNAKGKITGSVLVFRDVTAARAMANQLSWQATHDPLTGLTNRREFERCLGKLLASGQEDGSQHVLLYLDLDQFKIVNDTSGHIAGDELLRQIAALLKPLVRETDTLARLGGDEFGVLLRGCGPIQAENIAHKLREAVQDLRFGWKGKTFRVGVSIGLVTIGPGDPDVSALLSAADAACYLAKDKGRNRVWVHQADDYEIQLRQGEMQWIGRITQAFEEDRFRLYSQRIVPVALESPGEVYMELLVRMLDEDGRLVLPMAFIPAAERYGLMTTIDRWVVAQALAWLAKHPDATGLGINLSTQSLGDEEFLGFVLDQFTNNKVPPQRICFEITETSAIANWTRVIHFISALKEKGCRFALDDFGSGMSSFAYLKSLPTDFIKIDGIFVRDMVHDRIDMAMVETINHLGHVMGIRTIAEFVENEETLARLRALGVDYAQGFGIHAPEPLGHAAATSLRRA